jgi:hypothetical protein
MKYYDYEWDLEPNRILLDEELDIDKLGWKGGDIFRLIEKDGQQLLIKICPVEKFTRGFE